MTNLALAAAGCTATFIASMTAQGQVDPWNGNALYVTGGATASQALCTAASAAVTGQITVCFNPADNNTIRNVFLSARDNDLNEIYSKAISAD